MSFVTHYLQLRITRLPLSHGTHLCKHTRRSIAERHSGEVAERRSGALRLQSIDQSINIRLIITHDKMQVNNIEDLIL